MCLLCVLVRCSSEMGRRQALQLRRLGSVLPGRARRRQTYVAPDGVTMAQLRKFPSNL